MDLADKLEKRAKQLDRELNGGFEYNYYGNMEITGYDLKKVDDRELLEQAAKRICELERILYIVVPAKLEATAAILQGAFPNV